MVTAFLRGSGGSPLSFLRRQTFPRVEFLPCLAYKGKVDRMFAHYYKGQLGAPGLSEDKPFCAPKIAQDNI